jgi:hypothetical protein
VLLSAGSCADDAARGGSTLVRAEGDDALSLGVRRADELLVQVPEAIKPSLGTRLRSSASELSDDPQVRDALEGLAWETTCGLVFGEVPTTVEGVADFLLQRAVDFGIAFLDEAEKEMAGLVLDAFSEEEDEAEQACNDVRS